MKVKLTAAIELVEQHIRISQANRKENPYAGYQAERQAYENQLINALGVLIENNEKAE